MVSKTKKILVKLLENWKIKIRKFAIFKNFVLKPLIKKKFNKYKKINKRLYTTYRPGEIIPGYLIGRYYKKNMP